MHAIEYKIVSDLREYVEFLIEIEKRRSIVAGEKYQKEKFASIKGVYDRALINSAEEDHHEFIEQLFASLDRDNNNIKVLDGDKCPNCHSDFPADIWQPYYVTLFCPYCGIHLAKSEEDINRFYDPVLPVIGA